MKIYPTGRNHRYTIKNLFTRRPVNPAEFMTVRCHGCGSDMQVRSDALRVKLLAGHKIFRPCPDAPHICQFCRTNPARLGKAREAMEGHFRNCERRKVNSEKGEAA